MEDNKNDEYDTSHYYKIWRQGYIPTHYSYIEKLHKKIAMLKNKLKNKKNQPSATPSQSYGTITNTADVYFVVMSAVNKL